MVKHTQTMRWQIAKVPKISHRAVAKVKLRGVSRDSYPAIWRQSLSRMK